MRLKTIKYLLLLVSLMMSLQTSADAEVTTSIKLQVSKDSTTINRAPLKPLSPAVSYVEIVYNGVDKTFQDVPSGITPKGYKVYEKVRIEDAIQNTLGITRETFEEHFDEDPVRDDQMDYQQYEKDAAGKWVARTPDRYMGIVTNEPNMTEDPDKQYSTLVWTLTDRDVQELYSEWDKQTEKTFELMTAVKYEDIHGQNAHYKDVYVVFTTSITFKPIDSNKVTINVDWTQNKKAQLWYVKNSKELGSDEIHVSVPPVEDKLRNDADSLTCLLSTAFYNNEVVNSRNVTGDAGFVYNDYKYRLVFNPANNGNIFKGASGSSYILKVSDDGRELLTTTNQSIAKLVLPAKFADKAGDREEANYTMIEYQHSNAAHDLLNYASYSDDNALNVIIALSAEDEEGNKPNIIENGQFNVRFLRPIGIRNYDTYLNISSTDKPVIYLNTLFDFVDWRGLWNGINKKSGNPLNYYDYYGIKGIKIPGLTDGDVLSENHDVRCGFDDNGLMPLYKNDGLLDFIFHEDATTGNFLEIFRLSSTIQNCVLEIPFVIEYIWGEIYIKASFDVVFEKSYSLSIHSGSGGSIVYNGSTVTNSTQSFTVTEGSSATITITPNTGYKLKKLTVNGTDVTSSVKDNQYTISNISANTTIVATFEQITYTLSVQATGNGSVAYNGTSAKNTTRTFKVNHGTSATLTITPDAGYRLASLTVNGTNVSSSVSNNQYTISNITANTTVVATFEQIPATTYSLSIQSGAGGSVSFDGTTIVNSTQSFVVTEGTSATITISPNSGYRLSRLTVNGTNVTSSVSNNQYTISNITANTTIVVTFEQITYTLSVQATGNGSVAYNGTSAKNTTRTFKVNHGTSATLTITPDSGYRLASLTVNGTNVTSSVSNNRYTISNITASTTVVATFEQIPATTYSLSIQSGIGGSVSYSGTTVTNATQSFVMTEGSSATITVTPNSGYKLLALTVNGNDVTAAVTNNQYTISNITANTTVVATFKAISQSFSQDGINYEMRSTADYTLNVGKGNYSGHVVIPATVTYDGDTWTVAGVVEGAFNHSGITAITWNPRTVLSNSAFGSDMNPNMLVYVQSESYAPTNVQNIVANGRAKKIVLTDAASGNDFNCPVSFTAEEISYTHRYGMTTGIGECRGWETIALPFDVKQFTHESKGALVPFKAYYSGSPNKPFWLYELSASGFVEAESIEAYTPYIISMPNNDYYDTAYHLSGRVTFAATNAKVGVTELKRPKSGDKTFVPNFSMQAATENIFPLNVNNDFFNNNEYYAEGSHFVKGSRHVLPFEAYMTTSTANAKGIIPIFETLPTAIREIPMQGVKGVRIYSLSGELIMFDENVSIEDALKWLKRGVYFVNGKKIVVKLSEK